MRCFYLDKSKEGFLYLYSERGILTFFFLRLLLYELSNFLSSAINIQGDTLYSYLGKNIGTPYLFTEFDLGNQGFGSPDGALIVGPNSNRSLVFIEAKAISANKTWIEPKDVKRTKVEINQLSKGALDQLCRSNKYNSSLNGQLELRWRFINAIACNKDRQYITEEEVRLPPEILECDRFYWRRRLNPKKKIAGDWRRLRLENQLFPFINLVRSIKNFFLLSITDDDSFPKRLNNIRIFTSDGKRLSNIDKIMFWYPLSKVQAKLEKL